MDISVQCRSCGHEMLVTKNQLGKTAQCPACEAVMKLPTPVGLGPRLKKTPPVAPNSAKPEAQSLPTFAMACPACHARMRLLEKYRGTIFRCPDCNEPFTAGVVPDEPEEEDAS